MDANGSTASAGDILEYTLITQNTAKKLDVKHTTTESIKDLLDYAELSEAGLHAKLDADKNLVWPETTIVAGAQLKQVFKVKVKGLLLLLRQRPSLMVEHLILRKKIDQRIRKHHNSKPSMSSKTMRPAHSRTATTVQDRDQA